MNFYVTKNRFPLHKYNAQFRKKEFFEMNFKLP